MVTKAGATTLPGLDKRESARMRRLVRQVRPGRVIPVAQSIELGSLLECTQVAQGVLTETDLNRLSDERS